MPPSRHGVGSARSQFLPLISTPTGGAIFEECKKAPVNSKERELQLNGGEPR